MQTQPKMIPLAIAFEAGLGLVGWVIAWWFEVPLTSRLVASADVLRRCAWATLPMLALLCLAMRSQWAPVARLRRHVEGLVREYFGGARWWELAAVSVAAGVGEEQLFRGALQPLGERWLGPVAGLIAVSVLFGALHAASATYFVLATAVGVYLGWVAQRYDDLVTPMVAHAAYDFAALWLLSNATAAEMQKLRSS